MEGAISLLNPLQISWSKKSAQRICYKAFGYGDMMSQTDGKFLVELFSLDCSVKSFGSIQNSLKCTTEIQTN